jgi:hypothetical protein
VPALRELIAGRKCVSVPVALLDDLADQANRALTQRRAVNRLKANIVTSDLAKFPDIAGRLPTVGKQVNASASARQCDVEHASLQHRRRFPAGG